MHWSGGEVRGTGPMLSLGTRSARTSCQTGRPGKRESVDYTRGRTEGKMKAARRRLHCSANSFYVQKIAKIS